MYRWCVLPLVAASLFAGAQELSPKAVSVGRRYLAVITSEGNAKFVMQNGQPSPEVEQQTATLESELESAIKSERCGSRYFKTDVSFLGLLKMAKLSSVLDYTHMSIGLRSDSGVPTVSRAASCLALVKSSIDVSKFQGWRVAGVEHPDCLDLPATADGNAISDATLAYLKAETGKYQEAVASQP